MKGPTPEGEALFHPATLRALEETNRQWRPAMSRHDNRPKPAEVAGNPETAGVSQRCLKVCATCPWLVKNQGRPHKGGWYSKRNLLRLWNGIRLGKAFGMLCHSTDPNAPDYDGKPGAKPGGEKPCGGVVALICLETDALNRAGGYMQYAASREKPIARRAFAGIVSRVMFGEMATAVDTTEEIGLPWRQALAEGRQSVIHTLTPSELQITAYVLRRLVREPFSNGLPGAVVARIYDMGLVRVERWPACHVVVTERGRALLEEADAESDGRDRR